MTRAALTSFADIVALLQARPEDVARRYAPGGFVNGQQYRARNPGRADKRIGSFWVNVAGPHVGRFNDASTGEHGDMLDLIQLALGCDRRAALAEARAFLGIADDETEAQRALRQREAQRAREAAETQAREAEAEKARERRRAYARFLDGKPIENTPAAAYLSGRCVGPGDLGRAPGALRFHPALWYQHTDDETGEVFEGRWPAMVAAIHGPWKPDGPPAFLGIHRTWIARDPATGRWTKAPVPKAKKIQGQHRGGYVRLWSGYGPRGGKGAPISQAPEDAAVYIAEGIEDALSAAVLIGQRPGVYVICALNLGNMAAVGLPPQLRRVVLIADQDPGEKQRAQIDAAAERFAGEGRTVSVWRNQYGGKDLNDALRMARARERQEGAA
ncbi:MAG: hypothetical protein CML43_13585 [Rhodobacteraceae bacterium]|nr:hypothetical protein [Paracoccaceae bacterium]